MARPGSAGQGMERLWRWRGDGILHGSSPWAARSWQGEARPGTAGHCMDVGVRLLNAQPSSLQWVVRERNPAAARR